MTDIRNSQLFLDDRWIAYAHRIQRVWHEASYYPEPVIKPDRPWEGHQLVLFGSAVSDIGFDGFRIRSIWIAESDDGYSFTLRDSHLYSFRASS